MSDAGGPWGQASPRPPAPPPRPGRRRLFVWLGLLAAAGAIFLILARAFPAESADLDWGRALRLFGALALVSSAVVSARRFSPGTTAKIVAGWLAIFLVAVTAYALRDDGLRLALKVRSALIPGYAMAESSRSVVIGRGDADGFYLTAVVNGAPVRFVIDTGATDIVLSPADAERLGLHPADLTYSRPSETANGVGYSAAVTLDSLAVGPIRMTDVPAQINRAPMGASLLGMPFLRRLESFEVRGDQLFLRGRG